MANKCPICSGSGFILESNTSNKIISCSCRSKDRYISYVFKVLPSHIKCTKNNYDLKSGQFVYNIKESDFCYFAGKYLLDNCITDAAYFYFSDIRDVWFNNDMTYSEIVSGKEAVFLYINSEECPNKINDSLLMEFWRTVLKHGDAFFLGVDLTEVLFRKLFDPDTLLSWITFDSSGNKLKSKQKFKKFNRDVEDSVSKPSMIIKNIKPSNSSAYN